tara:strand:- start:377 stop:553 length:177 start_codon:yes stop_codon:yes gene_type:complete
MNIKKLNESITTFVKANFLKIAGVFLVIGLLQYACSKSEDVSSGTPVTPVVIVTTETI